MNSDIFLKQFRYLSICVVGFFLGYTAQDIFILLDYVFSTYEDFFVYEQESMPQSFFVWIMNWRYSFKECFCFKRKKVT